MSKGNYQLCMWWRDWVMFAEDLITRCSIKMKSNIPSLPVTPCSTNEAQMVGKENSPGICKSIML